MYGLSARMDHRTLSAPEELAGFNIYASIFEDKGNMSSFSKYGGLSAPTKGEVVELSDGELNVPDNPIIPFIEGDGIGPDIWSAAQAVLEAAGEKAYGSSRAIVWFEVLAP